MSGWIKQLMSRRNKSKLTPNSNFLRILGCILLGSLLSLPAALAQSAASKSDVKTTKDLKDGLLYVWIPPGTFMMGSPAGQAPSRDYRRQDGERMRRMRSRAAAIALCVQALTLGHPGAAEDIASRLFHFLAERSGHAGPRWIAEHDVITAVVL